jgi:protein tyrosine phosphatase (PTP) superfamily phosphohydrolase (DUF442 family)
MLLVLSAAAVVVAASHTEVSPASWAKPLGGRPGLENLYQVTDTLYRGAQPDGGGFATLRGMGVKTVVNLRFLHSDRGQCRRAGLDYVHVPMHAWEAEDDELARVLGVVTDPARQPVFVHCQHGADRTGVVCAAFRIVVQGWSREAAIEEMTKGGYGFHPVWHNLVAYLNRLDPDRLRLMAGLAKRPAPGSPLADRASQASVGRPHRVL